MKDNKRNENAMRILGATELLGYIASIPTGVYVGAYSNKLENVPQDDAFGVGIMMIVSLSLMYLVNSVANYIANNKPKRRR